MPVLWALTLGILAAIAAVWAMVVEQGSRKDEEDKDGWRGR